MCSIDYIMASLYISREAFFLSAAIVVFTGPLTRLLTLNVLLSDTFER